MASAVWLPNKVIVSAILVAFILSMAVFLYSRAARRDLSGLGDKERYIENRCGPFSKDKFRLCSYPDPNFSSRIILNKDNGEARNSFLRLSFAEDSGYYLGIHFPLTIILERYIKNGNLEFWLKGKDNFSKIKNVNLCLREGNPPDERIATCSVPAKITREWVRFSVPLGSFKAKYSAGPADDGNNKFSWAIQDILFSVSPPETDAKQEILVNRIKIIDRSKNKVIYDLF